MRAVSSALRRRLFLIHVLPACFGALLIWCIYLLDALFNIDVLTIVSRNDPFPGKTWLYLTLACAATVIAAIYSTIQFRKALHLATYGVELEGTIVGVGKVAAKGLVRIDCRYTYDGRSYRTSWTQTRDAPTEYTEGQKVPVIIDSDNPSRCLPKDEVLES